MGLPERPPFARGARCFRLTMRDKSRLVHLLRGDPIDATNNFGIWAIGPNDELQKIVREGDMLDVDDGPGEDLRVVKSSSIRSRPD